MRLVRLFALLPALAACGAPSRAGLCPCPPPRTAEGSPRSPELVLERVPFGDLPGWTDDAVGDALAPLVRSCQKLAALDDGTRVGRTDVGGIAGDWRPACARAAGLAPSDHAAARAFFEAEFVPFLARNNQEAAGWFTGYHESVLRGSRRRHGSYQTPLLGRPEDLVTVDLSRFMDDARGRRISGRVVDNRFEPYDTRAAIVGGSLSAKRLEIVWVDDPIDAFFVQIEGSGRVELDSGGELRVGAVASNGHRYTAIGRTLVSDGALTSETLSMQSIRAYLLAHPERADEVMNRNASYVFFEITKADGATGSQGVVLTPGRSMAVDRNFIPLSAPLWLDTTAPGPASASDRPLRRLVIAQDTGGAIVGPVRGDVFWGSDAEAADVAGRMRSRGRYFILLPTAAALRVAVRR